MIDLFDAVKECMNFELTTDVFISQRFGCVICYMFMGNTHTLRRWSYRKEGLAFMLDKPGNTKELGIALETMRHQLEDGHGRISAGSQLPSMGVEKA